MSIFGRFIFPFCVSFSRCGASAGGFRVTTTLGRPRPPPKGRHWRGGRHLVRCSHLCFLFFPVCVAHHDLFLKILFAKTKCHRNRNETLVRFIRLYGPPPLRLLSFCGRDTPFESPAFDHPRDIP